MAIVVAATLAGLQTPAEQSEAAFPGTNGRIVYGDLGFQIATAEADGSDAKPLTAGAYPAWSADGRIAFQGAPGIFVINEDGSGPEQLSVSGSHPSWSPDGGRIVYIDIAEARYEIWVMNSDGSSKTKIFDAADDEFVSRVRWSPAGDAILFSTAGVLATSERLHTIAPNGGALTTIGNGRDGDWSPDGGRIVFSRWVEGDDELTIANADGSNPQRVLEFFCKPGERVGITGDGEVCGTTRWPTWSPDGTRIMFHGFPNPPFTWSLFVVNANGTGLEEIVVSVLDVGSDWQPLNQVVHSVEFTQAMQELQTVAQLKSDIAGDGKPPVAVVEGKPAVMRVYFSEVEAPITYTLEVDGEIEGEEEVELTPDCTPDDQRRQENDCASVDFFFTPPGGEWEVTLTVSEDGAPPVEEHQFDLLSVETAGFDVRYLPVCVKLTEATIHKCPSDFVEEEAAGLTKKLFPVASDDFSYERLLLPPMSLDAPLSTEEETDGFLADLRLRYELMSMGGILFDQLAAWLPAGGAEGIVGLADPVWMGSTGRVSLQQDTSGGDPLDAQHTLTHELAHNLGLRHTHLPDGCGAQDDETDWPYGDSTIQEVGFDVAEKEAKAETKKELMTYCTPPGTNIWISPHSYNKLIDGDFGPQGASAQPTGVGGEFLVIRGVAQADGSSAMISSGYVIESSVPAEASHADGNYCLELSGGPEEEYCFTLEFEEHQSQAPLDSEPFAVRVPLPAATTRVALMRGPDELAALDASPAAPTLEITAPEAGDEWDGDETITWSASDGDGDQLMSAVLYSPDGGATWLPIDVDVTGDQISVDATELADGEALIRVLASDGLHTTIETAGPVTIAGGVAGDVDCNGAVNSVDGLKILQTVAGLPVQQTQPCPQIGSGEPPFGDVNCDGAVGAGDALFLLRFVAALPVNLPPGCPQIGARVRRRRIYFVRPGDSSGVV